MTSPVVRPRFAASPRGSDFITKTPSTSLGTLKFLRSILSISVTVKPTLSIVVSVDFCASGSFVLFSASKPVSSAFSSSPISTFALRSLPSRQYFNVTSLSIGVSATMRGNARISLTFLPSNSKTTSPAFSFAFCAGPPSVTLATKAPRALSRPRLSAISSVTV